jgi:hypothetical protein
MALAGSQKLYLMPEEQEPLFFIYLGVFARIRRPFAGVFSVYVLAMWFDGPLLAGQDPLGLIGLLHVPILAASLLACFADGRRANVLAPCAVLAMLLLVMLKRFIG